MLPALDFETIMTISDIIVLGNYPSDGFSQIKKRLFFNFKLAKLADHFVEVEGHRFSYTLVVSQNKSYVELRGIYEALFAKADAIFFQSRLNPN